MRARHVRKTRLRAETPRSQSGLRLRPRGGIDTAGAAVVCARDAVRCSQTEAESPRDAVGPRGHQRLPPPLLAASSSLPETGSRGERSYEISTDVSHTGRRGWAGRVAAARVSDEPSANGPARSHLTRGPSRDEGAQGGHAPERPVQPPPGPPARRPAARCPVQRDCAGPQAEPGVPFCALQPGPGCDGDTASPGVSAPAAPQAQGAG